MDAVYEKIKNLVEKGIDTQAETVYFFVECRKYLENTGHILDENNKFPTLKLVADWVVHSKLTRAPAINKLDEIGNYYIDRDKNFSPNHNHSGFVIFYELKKELKSFFNDLRIFGDFFEKNNWKKFVWNLYEVLAEIPLLSSGYVREFRFEKNDLKMGMKMISFVTKFSDGGSSSFSVDLNIATFDY